MIAEIRLKNFKRFRDLSLKAANLTVLTGANSAGKTSVLHSLLLARQMAKQPDRSHVELNGVNTLELGGVEDVIHREASDDLVAVEVFDAQGKRGRWSFRASSNDTRTLNAIVVDRPDDYSGALAAPAPQFCYLCAERLGPRDVLSASAADVAELDVGSRGEFVAQVLTSFDRSRVRPGRFESSSTETQLPSLLHQTESWMTKIVLSDPDRCRMVSKHVGYPPAFQGSRSSNRVDARTQRRFRHLLRVANCRRGTSRRSWRTAPRGESGGPFAPGWPIKDRRFSGEGRGGWRADIPRDPQRPRTERNTGSGRRRQRSASLGTGCNPLLPGRRR